MACGPPEDEQDMAADADFDLDVRCAIFGDYSQVPAMVCPPDWETHAEFDCRLRDFLTTKMSDLTALVEKKRLQFLQNPDADVDSQTYYPPK